MTIIAVPYHLDEYLPDLDLPLQPDQVGQVFVQVVRDTDDCHR